LRGPRGRESRPRDTFRRVGCHRTDGSPRGVSEKYRIRVSLIPQLTTIRFTRTVETISRSVPREGVRSEDPSQKLFRGAPRSAATAVYVFNRLARTSNSRHSGWSGAVESVLPRLRVRGDSQSAMPSTRLDGQRTARDCEFLNQVRDAASREPSARSGADLEVRLPRLQSTNIAFNRAPSSSLPAVQEIRVHRDCDGLTRNCRRIVADIDASLTGFFKRGGLTLRPCFYGQSRRPVDPASLSTLVSEASAQYDEMPLRLLLERNAECLH